MTKLTVYVPLVEMVAPIAITMEFVWNFARAFVETAQSILISAFLAMETSLWCTDKRISTPSITATSTENKLVLIVVNRWWATTITIPLTPANLVNLGARIVLALRTVLLVSMDYTSRAPTKSRLALWIWITISQLLNWVYCPLSLKQ